MDVLDGLLYINGNDVYKTYGAFLSEDREGDNSNYSELLKPPAMKPYTAVAFREQDGEKLPVALLPAFEARDVALQFAIYATSKADFVAKYTAFVGMLRSGWLDIRLPELDKTYRMYYQSCTEYSQLTPLDGGITAGKFKVKLREPKPRI